MKRNSKTNDRLSNSPKSFDENELVALVRYSQFLFHEGQYCGFSKKEAPDSPTQMTLIAGSFSNLVTGEVTEEQLQNLVRFFKAEVKSSVWGRILFYIINGGEPIPTGQPFHSDAFQPKPELFISELPRLFYPLCCLVPWCSNELPVEKKNTPVQRILCDDHTDQGDWKRIRTLLKRAVDGAFGFSSSRALKKISIDTNGIADISILDDDDELSLNQKFWIVWKGYCQLCRYMSDPLKGYSPRALSRNVFDQWPPTALRRICQLPDELPIADDEGIPLATVPTYHNDGVSRLALVPEQFVTFGCHQTYPKKSLGPTWLPSKAFDSAVITRRGASSTDRISRVLKAPSSLAHTYKLLTVLKDDQNRPVGWDLKPDPDNFILLEDLDGAVV
jgi:hypothetical protein